jgi:hypothetical protein
MNFVRYVKSCRGALSGEQHDDLRGGDGYSGDSSQAISSFCFFTNKKPITRMGFLRTMFE